MKYQVSTDTNGIENPKRGRKPKVVDVDSQLSAKELKKQEKELLKKQQEQEKELFKKSTRS